MAVTQPHIAEIRAFNRFYTNQIGLLEEQFADGPLTLAEARVLYEIDVCGYTTAGHLIRALRLDRGYLSRMLSKFIDDLLSGDLHDEIVVTEVAGLYEALKVKVGGVA